MSDFAIAGLCLLCWLNGVVFGWAFWELPRLDFAIAGLCLLYWLNGVVFGWAFWELPRLKKRKHDPVAWTDIDFKDIYISEIVAKEKNAVVPLYTPSPPQRTWVGLTDDEIMDMYNEPRSDAEMIAFGREVEAKLKEKNI